ncbi:MAG TPA: acyl carrier protein [Solirubrobacterales bacterium]|nr:acyl carrier protein [Solirubrobacterales bacterium]
MTSLRLTPLPGSPDPSTVDSSWAQLLPAGVTVVQPIGTRDDCTPFVLLGGDGDIPLAIDLANELKQSRRPAPLALLACDVRTAGAGELDLPVVDLGAEREALGPEGSLSRELRRLTVLGEKVHSFVDSELLDGQAGEVTGTTPLLELGIVDSISIVSIVAFIEEDLGIPVPEEQIHPRHLVDILSIRRLIIRLDAAGRNGHRR